MPNFSGPKCAIFIDGTTLVAKGTSANFQAQTMLARVDVLSDFYAQEIEPLGESVQGRIERVAATDSGVSALGFNVNGDTLTRINQPELTIQIYDQSGQTVLFQLEGVRLEARSVSVQARGLALEDLTFQARRVFDYRTTP